MHLYIRSVILIDSVYIKDKNYYPQMFPEKSKHVVKKKRSYFVMILMKKLKWKQLNI